MKNPTNSKSAYDLLQAVKRMLLHFIVSMVLAALPALQTHAQAPGGVAITDTPSSPVSDNSAILDLQSGQRGFLPPRMTTALRNAIESPAIGLTVFNTTDNCLQFFNGEGWFNLCDGNVSVMGAISSLDCSNAVVEGTLASGFPAYDVSVEVEYAEGNGGYHNGQTVSSTGVTGLTAVLDAGFFEEGSGTLIFTISGTPVSDGIASFALQIGGQSCTLDVNVIFFQGCVTPTVTDIDGNIYNTVQIGFQCWMKENLNVTRDANGVNINRICYNNISDNCDLYGGLYTWATVMNGSSGSNNIPSGVQGICPAGWHVPSEREWNALIKFAGGDEVACGRLKSTRTNPDGHPRWDSPNEGATDIYGFSALPAGHRGGNLQFYNVGLYGFWWTSYQYTSSYYFYSRMHYDDEEAYQTIDVAAFTISVRCVMD